MKLLNIIKEDDELSDQEREKIIKRGHLIYKMLKRGSFTIGEDTQWSKKRTFKYILGEKYISEIAYDFVSEESHDLRATNLLCVENIYMLFPYMSPGFKFDNIKLATDKLYEIFKKYDVLLHIREYGRCKPVYDDDNIKNFKKRIIIIDDENDWYNLFGNN